jgi:preprotein translocase subunit SecG
MFENFSFLNLLWWLLVIVYVPVCIGLIAVVLLQKGKGVGFAGAFGAGGGSETVFGPRSSRSLPQKLTYGAAAAFMILALALSLLSGSVGRGSAPALLEAEPTTGDSSAMDALFDDAAPAVEEAAPAEGVTEMTVETVTTDDTAAEEAPATEAAPAEAPAAEAAPEESPAPASEEAPVEEAAPPADAAPAAEDAPAEQAQQ